MSATVRRGATQDEPTFRITSPVVVVMIATTTLIMGNVVFVSPVLAQIAVEFSATQTQVQLIGDALPVMLAALLLPAGALLDRYGRRRGLIAGLLVLALSLIGSACVHSANMLIVTRCVAGAGAALAFPGTLSTITAVLPLDERSRGVALWSGACMIGGVWALLFAGALVEFTSTQGLFLAMAAVTVVCVLAVAAFVPETRATDQPRPDLFAAVLAVVGIGSLTYGIVDIPVHGLGDATVIVTLVLGLAGILAFVLRCLRVAEPLLDVRIFKIPRVALGFTAIYILFMCSQAWFFLGFQYNSYVFGWGPLGAAAGIAPAGATIVPFALLGIVFARRFDAVRVVVASLFVIALTSPILGWAGSTQNYLVVAVVTMIWGIGIGMAQAPSTQMIIDALPANKQGVASALNDLARELGAALGIAVIGSAFNAGYRHSVETTLAGAPLSHAIADSPAAGVALAARTRTPSLLDAVRDGVAHGWFVGLGVGGALVLVAAIAMVTVARRAAHKPDAVNSAPSLLVRSSPAEVEV